MGDHKKPVRPSADKAVAGWSIAVSVGKVPGVGIECWPSSGHKTPLQSWSLLAPASETQHASLNAVQGAKWLFNWATNSRAHRANPPRLSFRWQQKAKIAEGTVR